ncbi:MAG: UDP-3-O-(3-hydroxymyristoyl)glucosamine N-acyltransferase [Phycisphaerae bacterium]|nr:UDP-3-O-(3-hydroxymyristoyl)glucosamine N-acyltransferase [Phycisphaerae bacterium]
MKLTLKDLADRINAQVIGAAVDEARLIRAVSAMDAAGPEHVTFITSERHRAGAAKCQAGAVLVAEACEGLSCPQLVVDCVDRALIDCLTLLAPPLKPEAKGIHATAIVADSVQLGQDVCIGPGVIIEEDAVIGQGVTLKAGCKIGQGVKIGDHTRLDWNVVVYHGCSIGAHVIIQANATIGAVGFGYAHYGGVHTLVPHNGAVIIEDFVEIGASSCIDRAKFANTIVGIGTKIDNLVQIGHNVVIGKCCLLASQVGVAGSTTLGDGVVMAGQVGVADNITIGNGVTVAAQSGVMSHVPAGQTVVWSPALEQSQAMRVVGEVLRLPKTAKRVRQICKRLDKLEASENDKG